MNNKTNVCVVSGNPIVFNAFLQTFKKRMMPHVNTLYVYRDLTFDYGYGDVFQKFFEDSTFGLNVKLDLLNPTDERTHYKNAYPRVISMNSDAEAFVAMHDDCLLLNERIFKQHLEWICNGTYEIIFNVFGSGCLEFDEELKVQYPEVYRRHKEKNSKFMEETHLNFGMCTYWMAKSELLRDPNLDFSIRTIKPGEILTDLFPKPYVVKFVVRYI